jgi:hypothetical protein
MAAKTASLSVNIIGDASKAKAAFKEAENAAGGLNNQMKNAAKTLATAFVTKQFVNFAKSTIKSASDLGESINAVQVVFGDASKDILKFGETAAKTVGMSKTAYNSFAVSFGAFTKQIAGANGDVAKVTSDLTTRIADFASVMNLDIPEAAQKFQSALAGQSKPMREFGIDTSAAAVEAFALATGMVKTKEEMTAAMKIQATYGLLMKETAQTAGDFANTSDSLANRQRILAAEFENVKATIGESLLPAMESLLGVVGPLFSAFNSIPKPMQQTIVQMGFMMGATSLLKKNLANLGIQSDKLNKAIGGVRLAMAGFIIAEGIGQMLNQISDSSGNLDRKLQALQISLGDVKDAANATKDPLEAFRDLVAAEGKKFALGNIIKDFGKEVKIVGGSIGRDIEFIDAAFDKLSASSAGMGQKLLDAWRLQNDALDKNSQQYKDNLMLIDRYQDRLNLATGASNAMATANDNLAGSQDNAAKSSGTLSERLKVLGAQARDSNTFVEGLTDEWKRFLGLLDKKDAFENAKKAIQDYEETFKKAAKGNKGAQEEVNDKLRQGQREIARAMEMADLIPGSQAKKILFLTETGQLSAALALLKTVDSWYMRVQDRAKITPSGMGSGRLPGMASGGTVTSPGFVVVGERGPELLHLPGGASVSPEIPNNIFMPASIPSRMGNDGGGGTTINIQVQAGLVSSPDQVGQQIIDAIRRAERRSGQVFAAA